MPRIFQRMGQKAFKKPQFAHDLSYFYAHGHLGPVRKSLPFFTVCKNIVPRGQILREL